MTYSGTSKNDILSQTDLKLADWEMIDALAGDDTITGGNTNMQGGAGNDTIIGTSAYSQASYFSSPAGIDANLEIGVVKDGWGSIDHLVNIHNIQGTGFSDRITGSAQADVISGLHGGDFIDGGAGVDRVRYWNPSADFSVKYNKSDGSIDVTYIPFGQTDHLVNIETISFETDGVLVDANTFRPSAFRISRGAQFDNLDRSLNPRWVVGNVNGDPFPDLIIRYDPASSFVPNMVGHSPLQVFLGSASGAFIRNDSYFANLPEPTLVNAIVAGTFNKDDRIDIAVAASGQDAYENGKPIGPWTGEPSYFLISSSNGYSAASDPAIPSIFAHHASVGDINHDGYDDIYISSLTNAPSYFYMSDGSGAYKVDRSILPAIIANGPVRHDLVPAADGTQVYDYPSWTSDLLADFNNDGWDDLAVLPSAGGGPGLVFLNDKSGKFSDQSMMTLPPGPYGASLQYTSPTGSNYTIGSIFLDSKAIDLNNDGFNDIISITTSSDSQGDDFVYYRGASLQILINKNGSFADETSARTDFVHISSFNFTHYDRLTVVDFNQDGFQDVLIYRAPGNSDGDHATVFLVNDGHGFLKEAPYPGGIADGLFIPVDPEHGVFCMANSTTGANGTSQSVDTLTINWDQQIDFFTGLETPLLAALRSDVPGRWLHGNALDNLITLSSGNESAWGYGGSDVFFGGAGNDSLDGGDGVDFAFYSASFSASAVTRNDDGSTTITTPLDGTDVLTSVEYARFSDQTIALGDSAPLMMSASTGTTPENVPTTTAVYTVTATGSATNHSLIYSISGGADANLFNIDGATGAVTFKASPNFEAPTDAGANNTYDLTLRASNGSHFTDNAVAITVTDVPESATTGRDFNSDSKSDILLQNARDGSCYIWDLNSKTLVDNGFVGWAPGADWQAKGAGDFNGDGKSDILLQNVKDGSCYIWELNNKTLVDSGFVGWAPGPDWQAKGTGDFNGDGKSDVLLQNAKDGSCYIWDLNNKDLVDSGYIGWAPGPDWQAKGTGDFNGDGKSDILLQNVKDGSCYIWDLNNKALVDSGFVGWVPGPDWQAKGTGDFNGDGKSDILLQNVKDGSCYIWELNNKTLVDSGFVGWAPGADWQAKGTGDFNGDGKSDILLQNVKDGSCYIWELNSKTLVDSGYVGWAPGADWHAVA